MYIPKINRLQNESEIFRFMKENPFAIVVSDLNGEIIATHLPVEIEEDENGIKIIRTHMAKANPQWESFSNDKNVVVIFSGPHTYISSSWYDHVNVPTWNYIAIHVYGKVHLLDDAGALGVLDRLTKRYEQFSKQPFDMSQLNEQFIQSHLKALVAFEITIDRIDAKHKLSQNRNEKNYDLVIEHLGERNDDLSKAVKEEMEQIKKQLFPPE